jgi:hypothetical protein
VGTRMQRSAHSLVTDYWDWQLKSSPIDKR